MTTAGLIFTYFSSIVLLGDSEVLDNSKSLCDSEICGDSETFSDSNSLRDNKFFC